MAGPAGLMHSGPDLKPSPDPTELTRELIIREITTLRELLEVRIAGESDTIKTRLEAMDKAVSVFADNLNRVPTDVDNAVNSLNRVIAERFNTVNEQMVNIQKQFIERDVRFDLVAKSSTAAVEAALAAAKEMGAVQTQASDRAIAKSETATLKQLDSLGALIQANTSALSGTILDVKDRLTTIEGKSTGIASMWSVLIAIIGVAFGAVGIVMAILR